MLSTILLNISFYILITSFSAAMMVQLHRRRGKWLTKRFAKKLRLVSKETIQELMEVKGLVGMPIGTLLEISAIEPKHRGNGSYRIAMFSSVIKGKRTAGKVCLPQRLIGKTDFHPPPCIA